jgi:AcrR family transcriptional regulator
VQAQRSITSEAKDQKRQSLIQAAVAVFSKRGLHETKMQDIADEAGVGKGTLYEYFRTKEDLFLAVYDAWLDDYESEMTRRSNEAHDAVSRADALIDATIGFYERHADHASILLEFWAHALRSDDKRFIARIQEMKQRLAALGAQVTRDMVKFKAFTPVDVDSFTRLELGISDGIFLQWILDGKSYSLRDAYKFRQSVVGAGLMTPPFRAVMKSKTDKKLKEGFLNPNALKPTTSKSTSSQTKKR